MKPGKGQRTPRVRAKSTNSGNRFRDEARQRVAENLKTLGVASSPGTYKVTMPKDLATREEGVTLSIFPVSHRKRGAPLKPVTAKVIEAEAQRLFQGRGAPPKRKVSQQFWPECSPEQRYDNYRTTVKDHEEKIQARLSKLIGQ